MSVAGAQRTTIRLGTAARVGWVEPAVRSGVNARDCCGVGVGCRRPGRAGRRGAGSAWGSGHRAWMRDRGRTQADVGRRRARSPDADPAGPARLCQPSTDARPRVHARLGLVDGDRRPPSSLLFHRAVGGAGCQTTGGSPWFAIGCAKPIARRRLPRRPVGRFREDLPPLRLSVYEHVFVY